MLQVTTVLEQWPEANLRSRQFRPEEAASRVDEEQLKQMLRRIREFTQE